MSPRRGTVDARTGRSTGGRLPASEHTGAGAGPEIELGRSPAPAGTRRQVLTFSDLLPEMLGDDLLRERLARLYDVYRSLDAWCLADRDETERSARLTDVAALNVAVVEGLALQGRVDPEGFDRDGPAEVWTRMVELYLDWAGRDGAQD